MGKTKQTQELELLIYKQTVKMGTYGAFEATFFYGMQNEQRVDYITYDTKGIWKCYEIKVSVSDFHSLCKNSFVGNFNYYVMTKELYEQVKDEIPTGIGCFIHGGYELTLVKKAKRMELAIEEKVLFRGIICALSREQKKNLDSKDETLIQQRNRRIAELEKQLKQSVGRRNKAEDYIYEHGMYEDYLNCNKR